MKKLKYRNSLFSGSLPGNGSLFSGILVNKLFSGRIPDNNLFLRGYFLNSDPFSFAFTWFKKKYSEFFGDGSTD